MIWCRKPYERYFLQSQKYKVHRCYVKTIRLWCYMRNNCRDSGSKRIHHIKTRYFFIKDRTTYGVVKLEHHPTQTTLTDAFTKALQENSFIQFKNSNIQLVEANAVGPSACLFLWNHAEEIVRANFWKEPYLSFCCYFDVWFWRWSRRLFWFSKNHLFLYSNINVSSSFDFRLDGEGFAQRRCAHASFSCLILINRFGSILKDKKMKSTSICKPPKHIMLPLNWSMIIGRYILLLVPFFECRI